MFLSNTILLDGRGVFILLPKVQLHVSDLDNSHLRVVHDGYCQEPKHVVVP